jgi:YVTN family beta-propeller protein
MAHRPRLLNREGSRTLPTAYLATALVLTMLVASMSVSASGPGAAAVIKAANPIGFAARPLATGLALSPTKGPMGTSVTATGTGFPTSSPVGFELAGISVASSCSTDSAGNFPGTSGTSCSFSVPSAPAGPDSVAALGSGSNALRATVPVASSPYSAVYDPTSHDVYVANGGSDNVSVISDLTSTVIAQVAVGSGPYAIGADPDSGEIFAVNGGSDNVSVINDTTNTVVATVAVGGNPVAVQDAPGLGEVFVLNYNTDNVSVIAVTTNTVVATVNVGTRPYTAAYDSAQEEVFVSNLISSNVSVINATSNSLVATVAVGSYPYDTAYDSVRGEVFVPNYLSNNVSVISATTNTVTATVTVGTSPLFATYDSGAGEVFVSNDGSNTVSVISDASNSVIASIPVGSNPNAMSYNSGGGIGELFVINPSSDNVSVISDTSNRVVATVAVGANPTAIVYDENAREMFVPNYSSDNVSVIDAVAVYATATFNVTASLALSPSTGPIGSVVSASGTLFLANSTITFTVAGVSVASACSSDAAGDFPGSSGTACTFTVPAGPNGPETVAATDGVNTANSTFVVKPGLTLSSSSGPVGSVVSTTGTNFAPSATISFTFAGATVISACSTDSTGDFPGTSGTACSFTVPAVPKGSATVSATDGSNATTALFAVTPSLSIYPTNGSSGATVGASGTGFDATSTVYFSVAGAGVSSSCATDSTGSFPGSSGTACSFALPPSPGGVDSVVAFQAGSNGVVATDQVGLGPWTLVDDAATGEVMVMSIGSGEHNVTVINASTNDVAANISVGSGPSAGVDVPSLDEVFVANGNSGNVSVINATTNRVVANVAVGASPGAVAYASDTGQVFVLNSGSNSASVISVATNTVVATVGVGTRPYAAAYDSGLGEVFVSNLISSNVTVINTTSDTVVGTVGVGMYPYNLAYDSGVGEIFVENGGSDSVSVISDASNSVVATVAVGAGPIAALYDPIVNEVFIANEGSSNVSIISDSTNLVVGNVPVGSDPYEMAYGGGGGLGEVFVVNAGSSNVSVISDATNTLVHTIAVGSGSYGIAYDTGSGEMFVPNYSTNNVSVISVVSARATAPFDVSAELNVTSTTSSVDAGQSVTIYGSGFGNSLRISTFTLGAYQLNCTRASQGSCVGGVLESSSSGAIDAEFDAPAVTTSGTYTLTLTDTAGNAATARLTILTDPLIETPMASAASVDVGQSVTFSSLASFGAAPYSYAWYGVPAGCVSVQASFSCAPTAAGTFHITVKATDSNGYSVTSGSLTFRVYADPTTTTPQSSVLFGELDAGQTVTFSTVASLGTLNYTAYTWIGLPQGCSGDAASVTCSGANLPSGTYTISVSVTDTNNYTSIPNGSLSVKVDTDPSLTTPSASRESADVGQSVSFTSTASGGAGIYTFNWTGLPAGCPASTSDTVVCTLTTADVDSVEMNATDANRFTVTSAALSFTVYADPTVGIAASRLAVDVGEAVNLTASAASGSGGYSYLWSTLPIGCSASKADLACLFSAAGKYTISVRATDSNGVSATSASVVLMVAPAIATTLSASPSAPLPGEPVTFSANGTGGTGALTYSWSFGDGATGSGEAVEHTYLLGGTYNVSLRVNDSVGGSSTHYLNLTVASPAKSSSSSAIPFETIGVIVVVLVIVAILALLVLRRRRTGGSQPDQTEAAGPSEEAMADEPGGAASDGATVADDQVPSETAP